MAAPDVQLHRLAVLGPGEARVTVAVLIDSLHVQDVVVEDDRPDVFGVNLAAYPVLYPPRVHGDLLRLPATLTRSGATVSNVYDTGGHAGE